MDNVILQEAALPQKKQRDSSIELLRIITMFVIVAHHYVVNSGLMEVIAENGAMKGSSLFLLLFGWGGKTGINCFVMITGYFMCKSNITLKKFLKLLLEVEFYKILFYLIFLITGYNEFSVKGLVKAVLPVTALETGFTSCYIVFFLFIPFLNILIQHMSRRQHTLMLGLCLFSMTLLPTLSFDVSYSYVSWFMIIYLIGAYIRLYPNKWTDSRRITGIAAIICLLLSWLSVIACAWLSEKLDRQLWYYFVSDSNKILAVLTGISVFCFFKNLNMGYSKIINTIAASAFGVLLIHANSNAMRTWLWEDTLDNVSQYGKSTMILHAIVSVLAVYVIATVIDIVRIQLLEKPFFRMYDRKTEKNN